MVVVYMVVVWVPISVLVMVVWVPISTWSSPFDPKQSVTPIAPVHSILARLNAKRDQTTASLRTRKSQECYDADDVLEHGCLTCNLGYATLLTAGAEDFCRLILLF